MEKTTFGKQKKFSKSLHAANDPKSREIVKEFYKKEHNIILNDGASRYGVDLVSDDEKTQVEVEHRLIWKEPKFPFSDINVPERKKKFFADGKVDYVILSLDYSHIGHITGKKIKKYMEDEFLKESSNKHIRHGEYFYKVPTDAFTWKKI